MGLCVFGAKNKASIASAHRLSSTSKSCRGAMQPQLAAAEVGAAVEAESAAAAGATEPQSQPPATKRRQKVPTTSDFPKAAERLQVRDQNRCMLSCIFVP